MASRDFSYAAALAYLESFIHYEKTPPSRKNRKTFDLEGFRALLAELGDPQAAFPVIHAAGTKGKGSTCAMIASILAEHGLRTGLYTSPHLISYRERMRVNGRPIAAKSFAQHVAQVREAIEKRRKKSPREFRTTFEILTAAAFLEFRDKKVDVAVVETGLGGSLDATNAVTPAVAIVTPVSLDHTELLGNTVAKIARDKAGIIKKGCAVVLGPQTSAAAAALGRRCRAIRVRPVVLGQDWKVEKRRTGLKGTTWNLVSPSRRYENLYCPLAGTHQADNASIAVLAVQAFAARKVLPRLKERTMRRGLKKTSWPGRFQHWKPGVILDGAHNPESAKKLAESFRTIFPGKKAVLVLGVSREKDAKGIVEELAPIAARIVATQALSPRSLPAEDLARAVKKETGNGVRREPDPLQALRLARSMASPGQPVLVAGSLFLIGDILREKAAGSRTV